MKKLILWTLIAVFSVSAYNQYQEGEKEAVVYDAETVINYYDLNGDGIISESEQLAYLEDLYQDHGGDKVSKEEIESAVKEAETMLGGFDEDGDGSLSYDEELKIVQAVYEKYDNGEIKNELFRKFLEGYDKKVSDYNTYHDILDEVGVPGKNIQIEIRKGQ